MTSDTCRYHDFLYKDKRYVQRVSVFAFHLTCILVINKQGKLAVLLMSRNNGNYVNDVTLP